MNERKAVKYHDRLVEALKLLRECNCEGLRVDSEGRCTTCARFSCGDAIALLAEIEASRD